MIALLIAMLAATGIAAGSASGDGSSASDTPVSTTTSSVVYNTEYESTNPLYYTTDEYNAQSGLNQIKAAEAYAYLASQGKTVAGNGVAVSVIDSGLATGHVEFASSQDTANQYNEIDDNTDVSDDRGHGTHVAAIAMGNKDGRGMHGVAYDSDVMAIKVLNEEGLGTGVDIANAINRAIDNGTKVINLSLGSDSRNTYIFFAQWDASDADVVVISASGNDAAENPGYPAIDSTDFSGQIAVGSVDSSSSLSSFSNECGSAAEKCLVAPGENIYAAMSVGSTIDTSFCDGSGYCSINGTSMAAPHVSGAAAVLRAAWPTLTADQVTTILLESAHYLEGGTEIVEDEYNDKYGHGLLDLYAAVQSIGSETIASGTDVTSAGYDLDATSFTSDPIFGDAFSTNLASQLKSAVFFDDFGRDFKANLGNKIGRTTSYTVPSLDNLAFNNYDNKTIPLNFGKDGATEVKFQVNSFKSSENNENRIAPTYSQNRYGLKFLVTDKSQEDRFLSKSEGFSFAQNVNDDFKAGFSFNSNEIANIKGQGLGNPGFISVSSFGDSPYQSFVTGAYNDETGMQRNYNQIFASQKVLDKKLSLSFLHQNSYETNSNIGNVSNRQNQISDFSVTYLPGSKSNVSFSFGTLNEFDNNFLNSKALGAFETAGGVKTSYFKIATTRELMKNIYLVSSFSEGVTKANGNSVGIIRSYNDIRSRSSSIGLINEEMFGGKVGFIYSEPLRVYKGSASINVPVGLDADGNALRYQTDVSLTPLGKEQDFEMFYSTNLNDGAKVKFNVVIQKEAGNVKDIANNYLGFLSYNKKF